MKDFYTLRMLDLLKGIFEKAGINYSQLRKILTIKLTMDGRKMPTIFMNQNRKKKMSDENAFIKSLWVYTLFGLLLTVFTGFGTNYFVQMSIFFGMVMFFVMTSMIADFSSVLLDLRDKNILQTRPVDKRTINLAKSIHICIYLFFITIALTGIPLIVGFIRHGVLFFLLTFVELILADLLIVVITAIVYYIILRFYDGEKLKDIINFVQIGLTIAVTIGYQLLGRTMSLLNINISFTPKWWQFLIPPIWFGAPFKWLDKPTANPYITILSCMAFFIPLLALFIYYKMMPSFERNLLKLSNNSGKSKRVDQVWKNWIMNFICKDHEEKAFYQFAQYMMRTEREFRLKVYPSLGLSAIIPFILMINAIQMDSFSSLARSKWYLAIYSCGLMIPNAVQMLKYSGKYKGAWIYKVAPLQNMVPLFRGTLKAFIIKLFLPIYLFVSIIFLFIFGVRIIPDLLVGFVVNIFYTVICSHTMENSLPFSESFEGVGQQGGIKFIFYLFLIGAFILLHLGITYIPFGIWFYLAITIIVTWIVWYKGTGPSSHSLE